MAIDSPSFLICPECKRHRPAEIEDGPSWHHTSCRERRKLVRRQDGQPRALRSYGSLWDRFLRRVAFGYPEECWEWLGVKATHGYGQVREGGPEGGRMLLAHRVSYEFFVGPVPPGLELDHLCRNQSCVNPFHLEPVPHAVNNQRAAPAVCKRGHLLAGTNLIFRVAPGRNPFRECRACKVERELMRHAS